MSEEITKLQDLFDKLNHELNVMIFEYDCTFDRIEEIVAMNAKWFRQLCRVFKKFLKQYEADLTEIKNSIKSKLEEIEYYDPEVVSPGGCVPIKICDERDIYG